LDSIGEEAYPGNADAPRANEVRGGAVGAEPQRGAKQLRNRDGRNGM